MTQTKQSPVVVCDREAYQRLLCLRFPWNERPDPRGWMMDYITDYGYANMDREDELGSSDMVLSYLDEIAAFQKQHPGVPLEIALSMTDLFSER